MSETFASLSRYMPEWMAARGTALLGGLPSAADRWVQQTAQALIALPGPPDRNAWQDEIIERFCRKRGKLEQAMVTNALRCAVLLVAIQALPPPEGGEQAPIPAETVTKKLNLVAVKRSRMLGLLERGMQAEGPSIERVLAMIQE